MPAPTRPPESPPLQGRVERMTPQWLQWLDNLRTTLAPPNTAAGRVSYIPTTSGEPTFTPEMRGGFVAATFDPATGTLYIFDNGTPGSWLSVVLS